ncbi:MAG: glycosyltransferase family 2 protein, partial [Clostridia bacterium]|nr:glycosyltransferase family 2 protein [Clostridia bacterium]
FQHLGSWVVRLASHSDIPDAPSGFRAYSREAALRLNVVNEYTYTLETIIQAGWNRTAMTSVPIRTNPDLRPSRLFKSMWKYMKRSASVIVRSFAMYKPMRFFGILSLLFGIPGLALGIRFLWIFASTGSGSGHVQSLILCALLLMISVQFLIAGIQADLISDNRKLLEDVQYRVRKMEIEVSKEDDQ